MLIVLQWYQDKNASFLYTKADFTDKLMGLQPLKEILKKKKPFLVKSKSKD